jgi:hypothetical protein
MRDVIPLSQPGWPTNSLPPITKTAIVSSSYGGKVMTQSSRLLFRMLRPVFLAGQQSEHPTEEARRLVILFDYFAAIQALGQNRVTMIRSG